MAPLQQDPMAPRKKYALLKFVREWNEKHPTQQISRPDGFDPDTTVIGSPARYFLKNMQRTTGMEVTGHFSKVVMRKLLPPGIRSEVMADAHAEEGVHEWPPYSNRGEVMKYLKAVGILFGAPWCGAYVSYILKANGFKKFPPNPAYVPSWLDWAKKQGILKPMGDSQMGDLWIWNWDGGTADHIGFCDEGVKGNVAYYLDGNVGASGGTVTDSHRPSSGIASVIDLVKLKNL
jgi:hypothetical protein